MTPPCDPLHSPRRNFSFGNGLFALLIPVVIVACAAAPHPQETTASSGSTEKRNGASSPDASATYHFMLGYQAELAQETERAITEYRAALKSDPSSVAVKARLASIYFGIGDLNSAAQYAEEVGESTEQDVQVLTQMAGILASAGKPDRAIRLLDQAIKREPERGETYFPKGIILLNQKQLAEAEQAVVQGLKYAPDSPIGHYYLGRISVEAQKYEQAVASFERAIAANPAFEPAYMAQATLHESRQEKDKAIAVLQNYLQRVNLHNKDVRQHLIQLYISTKDYAGGLAEVQKMLEDNPDDLDAQLRRALIYGEKKEYAKAIEQLNGILQVKPGELKVRDYLAYLYEESKEYPKAIEAYQLNIRHDPSYIDSHLHLGVLQYRIKAYSEAVAHLGEAIRLNPKQPEPYIVKGLAFLQMEQFESASQTFEEGLRYNPKNADLHFNLGTAYDKLDRFDDVVRAMEAALSLDPHHADALNYLGYSYAERGIKIDQALSLTKQAVALKPENGYFVDSLGWAFYKSGMLSEALTELKKAVSLAGDDPVIYEHLGEIYWKQQQIPEAREAWIRSIALDPKNSKLIERFKAQGMGDPLQDDRVRQALQRVSERVGPPSANP